MMKNAIIVQIAPLNDGGEAIMLLLRADAIVELYGGNPQPGVTMSAAEARDLAAKILSLAERLESGERPHG